MYEDITPPDDAWNATISESNVSAELISVPTLVQVAPDLWVNPAAVAHVHPRQVDSPVCEVEGTVIRFIGGEQASVDRPVDEVVARINGDDPDRDDPT